MKKNALRIASVCFILVVFGTLCYIILDKTGTLDGFKILINGNKTNAQIVAFESRKEKEEYIKNGYYILLFKTKENKEIKVKAENYDTNNCKINDVIEICYKKDDPTKVVVNKPSVIFILIYSSGAILVIIGIIAILIIYGVSNKIKKIGKPQINIKLDKDTYSPGEIINGVIEITSSDYKFDCSHMEVDAEYFEYAGDSNSHFSMPLVGKRNFNAFCLHKNRSMALSFSCTLPLNLKEIPERVDEDCSVQGELVSFIIEVTAYGCLIDQKGVNTGYIEIKNNADLYILPHPLVQNYIYAMTDLLNLKLDSIDLGSARHIDDYSDLYTSYYFSPPDPHNMGKNDFLKNIRNSKWPNVKSVQTNFHYESTEYLVIDVIIQFNKDKELNFGFKTTWDEVTSSEKFAKRFVDKINYSGHAIKSKNVKLMYDKHK